jgi:hypothetical protein
MTLEHRGIINVKTRNESLLQLRSSLPMTLYRISRDIIFCPRYVWPQPTERNTRGPSLDTATVSANGNTLDAL